jgi:hypothetical protein
MSNPLAPLVNKSSEPIEWDDEDPFHYPNMVRIRTINDGSGFFHAVLNAYFIPYRSGKIGIDDESVGRREMVVAWREMLAKRLAEPYDKSNPKSPMVYDVLSRGKLRLFGASIPNHSLYDLQAKLGNPSYFADESFLELVSNEIGRDIYILDGFKHDVYRWQSSKDDYDLFYKHRPSIVLIYIHEHFELVGIAKMTADNIMEDVITHFNPDHPFIQKLYQRVSEVS